MRNYFTNRVINCVTNPNVPDNAYWIGRTVYSSGEIKVDFYCLYYEPAHPDYGGWALWKVGDWKGDKPTPTSFDEMEMLGVDFFEVSAI